MILRKTMLLMALWLTIACSVHARDAPLGPAASSFLRSGPAHALRGCDLWHRRCKEVRLRVLESGDGEANDVPRHWARMSGPGVSVDVTFELPTKDFPGRPHPSIERLQITTPRWPLLSGLRLGDPRAKVSSALGEPSDRSEGCWRYADAPDDVSLCFGQDRLQSVTWTFFID